MSVCSLMSVRIIFAMLALGQSPPSIIRRNAVVILINATILMHKSTLSSNNFGNKHFG